MSELLKMQRNKLCPCDSGKKYKKCCHDRVEEQEKLWKNEGYYWMSPEMKQALALVSGLEPDKKEEVPDFTQLKEAADELDKGIFNKELEIKAIDDYISRLLSAFTDLLKKDDYFQEMRLSLTQGIDILQKANNKMSEEEPAQDHGQDQEQEQEQGQQDKMAVVLQEVIRNWLAEQIDERRNDWFLWKMMDGLRKRSYTLEERATLLFSIYNTLSQKAEVNQFWDSLIRVVISESFQALNQLGEITGEGDDSSLAAEDAEDGFITEKMNELMQQNPTYRREVMARISEISSFTMDMISEGKLKLELPPYAVLGGLLAAKQTLRENAERVDRKENEERGGANGDKEKSAQLYQKLMEKVQYLVSLLKEENMMETMSKNWIADYDLFIDSTRQVMEQWLQTEGKENPKRERELIKQASAILGSGHEARLSFFLYLAAVAFFLEKKKSVETKWDGEVLVFDNPRLEKETGQKAEELFTSDGLEQYAKSLEEEQKTGASQHVRKYK